MHLYTVTQLKIDMICNLSRKKDTIAIIFHILWHKTLQCIMIVVHIVNSAQKCIVLEKNYKRSGQVIFPCLVFVWPSWWQWLHFLFLFEAVEGCTDDTADGSGSVGSGQVRSAVLADE